MWFGTVTAVALWGLAVNTCVAQSQPSPYTYGYRYDAAHRVTGTIKPDPDAAGPIHYAATRITYSQTTGLKTKVEYGELSQWQDESIKPSAWGALFTVFRVEDFTYDAYGMKLTQQLSSGGVAYALTQSNYDGLERLKCSTVRMNTATYGSLPDACTLGTAGAYGPDRITYNTYDATVHVLNIQHAYGTSAAQVYATYTYSGSGQQTTIADANNNLTSLVYDGLDRLQYMYFPSKTTPGTASSTDYEQYSYYDNGPRKTIRKRDNQVVTYYYDGLKRLVQTQYPAGTIPDVYVAYDLRGLRTSAQFGTAGAKLTTAYDGFGEPLSSGTNQSGATLTLAYQYDLDGNRTHLTFPDGVDFTYGYDGLDRISSLSETSPATQLIGVTYDNRGQRTSLVRGASVATTSYGFDNVSRLTTLTHNLDGSGTANDETLTFTYSPASQIASRNLSNAAYSYPATSGTSTIYSANGLNQYATIKTGTTATPTYDPRGNLTWDGSTNYVYDIENRLLSTSSGHTATLTYDPVGRLFQTSGNGGGAITFLHDGDQIVAEFSTAGALLRRYVAGTRVDEPLVWYEGSTVGSASRRYLFADHQGSIVAASSSTGAKLEIDSYDPYGAPALGNAVRFQFTGQVSLPEAGLYYYRARMYSPQLGRFIQTDPVGYKGDLDLYTYVGNDPLDKTDPSGNEGEFLAMRLVLATAGADAVTPDPSDAAAPAKAAGYVGAIVGTAIGGAIVWTVDKLTEPSAPPTTPTTSDHQGRTDDHQATSTASEARGHRGGQGQGERGRASKPSGTPDKDKHSNPGKGFRTDPQTGKKIPLPPPPEPPPPEPERVPRR
jgi:RHS repeat-associated protein